MNKTLLVGCRSALLLSLALFGCGPGTEEMAETQSARQGMHSWGNYHWARTSNPFTLKLGDNVTSAWDSYLSTSSSDWSKSTVLDTTIVAGNGSKRCSATSGRVEVCNDTYGNNGWLGLAQIWASGSHITQGLVKMNDTYFNTTKYNTPAWRNSVMCQEIGHTLGLDHNDEDFNTVTGTCMDYANDPTKNQHPNAHDYEQLETIYAHLDSTTTVSSTMPAALEHGQFSARGEWGELVHSSPDGRVQQFSRAFGDWRLITTVTWAE